MYPMKADEYEFLYGNRLATVFRLNGSIKIIGFINGNTFELRVMTIGNYPRRKGWGKRALQFLRPKFRKISVTEICEEALPFWLKMKECGLVDNLWTIKDGRTLYLIKRTTKLGRAG
ncbi:hypothetical protein ACOBQJ_08365 [Pelotomaculum propionicicum]|uniref:hypothetical protein n=1 Tax=Pelotomaculum propionicicum TaxID=258475 RepID=UPI003B7CB697